MSSFLIEEVVRFDTDLVTDVQMQQVSAEYELMLARGTYSSYNTSSSAATLHTTPGMDRKRIRVPSPSTLLGLSANELNFAAHQALENKYSSLGFVVTKEGQVPGSASHLPSSYAPPLGSIPQSGASLTLPVVSAGEGPSSNFNQTSPKEGGHPNVPVARVMCKLPTLKNVEGATQVHREGSCSPTPLLHNPLLNESDGATNYGI